MHLLCVAFVSPWLQVKNEGPIQQVFDALLQDLADKLATDPRRGLPWLDEEDAAVRREMYGANRMADREDVTFASLVLEALQVRRVALTTGSSR